MPTKQGSSSFMEALNEVRETTTNVSKSKIDIILSDLQKDNPDMCEDLKVALKDTSYSSANISKTLKSFGYSVSDSSVKRWRQMNNE
jgi:hypothetical protein